MPCISKKMMLCFLLGFLSVLAVFVGLGPLEGCEGKKQKWMTDYRIALLSCDLPGHDPALGKALVDDLGAYGFKVDSIDADGLADAAFLQDGRFDLLVLPGAFALPQAAVDAIARFRRRGGDVLALQAPAFTDMLWKSGTRWMSREMWRKRIQAQTTRHMVMDFESVDPNSFRRSSNTPKSPTAWRLVPAPTGKALLVQVDNMQGWDTLQIPVTRQPFPAGHGLTCFYARGSTETRALSLEWRETDGARWIAVFPVTRKWRRVVLAPEDFKFWESVPGRGGPGDRFRPENAAELTVGVAWTHTGPRGGRYEYAIDQIGTAPDPLGTPPLGRGEPPGIEGLSPAYKFYPLRQVKQLRPRVPWLAEVGPLPIPAGLKAHHPRPTGKGIDKGRACRWIPVVEALGAHDAWRGAPISLLLHTGGAFQGSILANAGVADASWYRKQSVQALIRKTVARMARGVFLAEGGSERFTVWAGEKIRLGARVSNLSKRRVAGLTLRYRVCPASGSDPVMAADLPVALDAGHQLYNDRTIGLPEDGTDFLVEVTLLDGHIVLDRITHQLGVLKVKPKGRRDFVTARKGDFWRRGKPWFVYGVNYMPSTGIALDHHADFEFWLGKRPYDPEFVQRDLERCRDMGLNSVSIFIYHRSAAAGNLLDILRRCEKLGLMVNLSIRPGTPMAYEWGKWEEIITGHKLPLFDIIYAYDIAWEPFFGTLVQRRRYDSDWRAWIVEKYGSVSAAESAWDVPAPRFQGRVSSPVEKQLGRDGPHRTMVADYRRFVDALVHRHYQAAADRIRAIDPHHLISFRMTVTGDPTFYGAKNMPYDFPGVARSMDFLSPEGYGRIGDWDRVKPGIFTVAYGRFCAPDKPVLWAEAGVHAWNVQTMQLDQGRLDYQAQFYADFCRMVRDAHANGVVWWWYPGGYRTNERSDYGIIHPDGTDRKATMVVRRNARSLTAPRKRPRPDVWIDIDRDADARGLFGVYEKAKERFWAAIKAGATPGLRRR